MNIIKLSATQSTNDYLKELGKQMPLMDPTIVVTKQQTKGRGQQANSWQSQEGKSLTFSLYKRFTDYPVKYATSLNFAVSLGIKDALDQHSIPKIKIKWPNDIMSCGKKVCGILIENQLLGNKISASVIGIGVNVNETEFKCLPQASSLRLQSGQSYDLEKLLVNISEAVLKRIENTLTEKTTMKMEYEAALFRKGKVSVFQNPAGARFNGMIQGVSQNGALIIENEAEELQEFQLKEIKLLF